MKKSGILNPDLSYALARLGHTDMWAIADCGLPIPDHVEVIDLALVFGIPTFAQVSAAILDEVVVEGVILAEQTPAEIRELLPSEVEEISHEELKKLIDDCAFVVRTGDTTAYANAVFKAGVAF